jgi:hypothetical protein
VPFSDFPNIKDEEWPEICRHVTEPYLRDRIRTYKKRQQRWVEAALSELKYMEVENELRKKYPYLFKKDGTFEEVSLISNVRMNKSFRNFWIWLTLVKFSSASTAARSSRSASIFYASHAQGLNPKAYDIHCVSIA